MSKKREVRFLAANQEVRAATNDKGERTITGRAVPYESLSEDLGGFREKFAKGALDRCLKGNPDLLLITEHNVSRGILARTSSGTLTVASDDGGLSFTASLPPTTLGNDTAISLDRGDLKHMSFSFGCDKDQWEKRADGTHVRTVLEATLYELSVVSSPAYPQSSAAMRSLCFPEGAPELPADLEKRDDAGDEPECQCQCEQCLADACGICSNDDCDDDACGCGNQERSIDKLLAAIVERRLRG